LSFAQFEREVIGERVRDKIAASKAKGIWVGGSVPLGYKSINKKLVVVSEEAETVRLIFRRYLELGSVRELAVDLDRRGIRTRKKKLNGGSDRGGVRFGVGYLAMLLRNRFTLVKSSTAARSIRANSTRSWTGSCSTLCRTSLLQALTCGCSNCIPRRQFSPAAFLTSGATA
jgi:hypothetical protein